MLKDVGTKKEVISRKLVTGKVDDSNELLFLDGFISF